MAAKDVKFSRDARERMLRGVNILADAVKDVDTAQHHGRRGRILRL